MGGGGQQKSTQTQTQGLPGWEQEPAKAYVASLMNYVFPGVQVPQSWFSTRGFGFPAGGAAPGAGGGATGDTSAAAQMMQQIDPSGTAYGMFAPMISGSPFLQNMAAQHPAAIAGATSPAAASQLAGLYSGSGVPGQAAAQRAG